MTTFAEEIAKVPYTPRQTDAAGLLAPVFRAVGHILFATALSSTQTPDAAGTAPIVAVTDEEILEELRHAGAHWNAINQGENLSTATGQVITALGAGITNAVAEYPEWPAATKTSNLRDLANRTAGLASVLDRELAGIRDSDPGYAL